MSIKESSEMAFYFRVSLLAALLFGAFSLPNKNCAEVNSCVDCIRIPDCSWCSLLKGSQPGALNAKCLKTKELAAKCEVGQEEAPVSETIIPKPENSKATAQLQPQKLSLQLRAGASHAFEFTFNKANDYPIDLYFLMDFSKSMLQHKENLAKLGSELLSKMKQKTSSLHIGFGTFVDKVALPFTDNRPEYIRRICPSCALPYLFKNHMPLSSQANLFSKKLAASKLSANLDTPEGGFDGLLQAVVCSKQINWRNDSRRIIVFCTDAPFHIAGDGKLVGVVEPHDGQCHLNENGEYTHGLQLDYPSIGMIRSKVKEFGINLIFAVTENREKIYSRLKNEIKGSSVGILNSANSIVNLVLDNYNKMSLTLNMTHNASSAFRVILWSKCPGDDLKMQGLCSALKGGQEVKFLAEIQALDCAVPEETIELKPVGMVESLTVHVKVACKCQCRDFEAKSKHCENVGDLSCGKCVCPDTHFGQRCECPKKDARSRLSGGAEFCRRGNTTCSGRGKCICGTCSCDDWPKISGDFCECDNFACPGATATGICSDHGICDCGTCVCEQGWEGSACNCSTSERTCQGPNDNDGVLCSGHGVCKCGRCMCDSIAQTGKKYTGDVCERCTDCKIECTKMMHDCVDCLVYEMEGSVSCSNTDCQKMFRNITTLPNVSELQNISASSVLCQPLTGDEEGCTYLYVPYYHDDELWLFANNQKTCPQPVPIVAISAGVAGSTILAGLIFLLLWKLVTTVHDKREFEKFEQERADTKWGRGDNPLYRKALTTHMNPMFRPEED